MRRGTIYGQKGGEGPTRGKKATTYVVALPDGTTARKRAYSPPTGTAVGYAYQHEGKWFVAAIDEPDCPSLSHYVQCPAKRRCPLCAAGERHLVCN